MGPKLCTRQRQRAPATPCDSLVSWWPWEWAQSPAAWGPCEEEAPAPATQCNIKGERHAGPNFTQAGSLKVHIAAYMWGRVQMRWVIWVHTMQHATARAETCRPQASGKQAVCIHVGKGSDKFGVSWERTLSSEWVMIITPMVRVVKPQLFCHACSCNGQHKRTKSERCEAVSLLPP